jgi:pyruvate formate lyase activating enzyme
MQTLVTNIQGYSIHDGPGIRTVVFLKGCNLTCLWCSNPECISTRAEIGFYQALCTRCGKCDHICPVDALSREKDLYPVIDRRRCTGCGVCAAACWYQALTLFGQCLTVEEVFKTIQRDAIFYQGSGGGITLSGGEVLRQPQFVRSLFELCRRANIHTCIETSGQGTESSLRVILEYADLVLFDLKHLDSSEHKRYTGHPNHLILDNARVVAGSGIKYLFRMPLIPGLNDSSQNIKATADFIVRLGGAAPAIELMPYHRLGQGKYNSLDKNYPRPDLATPGPERLEQIKTAFIKNGIACTISR